MRGLDLAIFDFDHDLTWTALMLDPQGRVLGRYGNPGTGHQRRHHLAGLRHALEDSLRRFTLSAAPAGPPGPRVDQYAGAARFGPRACFHCHHVRELQREEVLSRKAWSPRWEWHHPPPEVIGVAVDPTRGNRVVQVIQGSPADRAGWMVGDDLATLNAIPIAAEADLRFALDRAPFAGKIPFRLERRGKPRSGLLDLAQGWKEHDVSWRWSLRALKPDPPVRGDDLTPAERRTLGLKPKGLAFRQWPFVGRAAQQAGIQAGDVIVAVDGRSPPWTARQFEAYIRMHHLPGDRLGLQVLRGGKRFETELVLP